MSNALWTGAATEALPPRARSLLFFVLAFGFAPASLACGAGSATGGTATSAGESAGEPTCEDRARIAPLCTKALTERCQSQMNDCEATCDDRAGLPANTRKAPSERNEHIAIGCRQDCRAGYDACVRSLVTQCPKPCT